MLSHVFKPFFVTDGDTFVPNEIAQGGWGPTLGGQVLGGLLARAVEQKRADSDLIPARFTVDILRRVATAPVKVHANVVRTGRRMQAIGAKAEERYADRPQQRQHVRQAENGERRRDKRSRARLRRRRPAAFRSPRCVRSRHVA